MAEDLYCYYNDGLSRRMVPHDHAPQAGEQIFSGPQSTEELSDAFPRYAALSAAQALEAEAFVALQRTDLTMTRIAEAVSLGLSSWTADDVVAWVEYRRALRAVVSTGEGPIPDRPAYPQNT